ncbi:hypothetical protein NHQ30_004502 [Ciborinia camelliae]|nr:hypothetical protein NHQ30_004502 [Ciborinia camelliae]
MSASRISRPDLPDSDVPSQESQKYLYLCVSESEDDQPFEYNFTLVTGNVSKKATLFQHKAVDICPCGGSEECGLVGLEYRYNHLFDSSQKVLTLIQVAKVKNVDLLEMGLYKLDLEKYGGGILRWWIRAMMTLVWENRTGRILEFNWEFDIDKVEYAAENFTYSKIVKGEILEGRWVERDIPVFDMATYHSEMSKLNARDREVADGSEGIP